MDRLRSQPLLPVNTESKLRIAPKLFAAVLALQSVEGPLHAAEITNGTSWPKGLIMMNEDARSKPYEVGGLVISRSKRDNVWQAWRRGDVPKTSHDAPEIRTPFDSIVKNLPENKDGYICTLHSHIEPQIEGLLITSMPPTPADALSTIMATLLVPEQGVGRIKHAVVDGLGIWTFGHTEVATALRQRIKTQADLNAFISQKSDSLRVLERAGALWTIYVGQLEVQHEFGNRTDAEKVALLRSTNQYKDLQNAYKAAGFKLTYATRDEAATSRPCDETGR